MFGLDILGIPISINKEFINKKGMNLNSSLFYYTLPKPRFQLYRVFNDRSQISLGYKLKCMKELHDLGIYHRDIKPDNYF